MVLEYCSRGNLARYIDENFHNMTWSTCLDHLLDLAHGLNTIHSEGLMHRDFHSGNLLIDVSYAAIGDLGLCHPADQSNSNDVYGVMPYVAPEVLRGKEFTQAADIYSFGIIMWELSSGYRPFAEIPHNLQLALRICDGVRPAIVDGTPKCYKELMQKCWHNNPDERPSSANIVKVIGEWLNDIENDDSMWHKAEKDRKNYEVKALSSHPQAVYKSKLLPSMTSKESYILVTSEKSNNFSLSKMSNNSCDELIIG
ncbi:kinase-like domain-containing protein [Glomus cerebriforme]|uniref:Kinase-like domain-containing protein n=1 Tax=Glomus cerebriforme TaxID=658196 RepID=A0A397S219_9GLOM|nr:kinase-like domain-containing protein [Glomus cerebriforme]